MTHMVPEHMLDTAIKHELRLRDKCKKLEAEKAELLELVKVLEWRPLLPISGSSNFCCICKGQEDSGHKFGCPVDVIRKKMEGE